MNKRKSLDETVNVSITTQYCNKIKNQEIDNDSRICIECNSNVYKIENSKYTFCPNKKCLTCYVWDSFEKILDHKIIIDNYISCFIENKKPNIQKILNTSELIKIFKSNKYDTKQQIKINDFHRSIHYFLNYEIDKYKICTKNINILTENQLDYLLKEINEKIWKSEFYRIYKNQLKNQVYYKTFLNYINEGIALLIKIKDYNKNDNIINLIEESKNRLNLNLLKINNYFDQSKKVKVLNDDFIFK